MKIVSKRDRITNVAYGSVIYTIDEFGNAEKEDPYIVVNAGYKESDDSVFCVSLRDGVLDVFNENTVVELADVTLTVNQY